MSSVYRSYQPVRKQKKLVEELANILKGNSEKKKLWEPVHL